MVWAMLVQVPPPVPSEVRLDAEPALRETLVQTSYFEAVGVMTGLVDVALVALLSQVLFVVQVAAESNVPEVGSPVHSLTVMLLLVIVAPIVATTFLLEFAPPPVQFSPYQTSAFLLRCPP